MNADTGTVGHDDIAIESLLNLAQNMIPDARLAPSNKAVVAGCIRAISIRNVCPGRACPKAPQDTVDHPPVVNTRHATQLIRQQGLNNSPLEIGQIKSATGQKRPPNQGFNESKSERFENLLYECAA